MKLDHVLLPCKMTSRRILRKNLAVVGGRSLLDLGIDRFQLWYPDATIWVATEDRQARQIAEIRGCRIYPLTESDTDDKRNVSELFTEWLSHRDRSERCCYAQLTSPFTFRYELDIAINDPRPYVRSAWFGRLVESVKNAHGGYEWHPLTQSLPERVVLTGNFGVANGQHVVTMQDESTEFLPVSWLSAIDIDNPTDLQLAQHVGIYMSLTSFDLRT